MTLLLNLPSDKETRLREIADQDGKTPEEYALSLLDQWLLADEQDFQEAAAAVGEGLTDLENGDRGMLLEDYRAQLEMEYRRQDEAAPAKAAA